MNIDEAMHVIDSVPVMLPGGRAGKYTHWMHRNRMFGFTTEDGTLEWYKMEDVDTIGRSPNITLVVRSGV
jgi:hypothetical protein